MKTFCALLIVCVVASAYAWDNPSRPPLESSASYELPEYLRQIFWQKIEKFVSNLLVPVIERLDRVEQLLKGRNVPSNAANNAANAQDNTANEAANSLFSDEIPTEAPPTYSRYQLRRA